MSTEKEEVIMPVSITLTPEQVLESVIERHYKAYLEAYAKSDDLTAIIEQDFLKDLYTIKNGKHPNEDTYGWLGFWRELGEEYGTNL